MNLGTILKRERKLRGYTQLDVSKQTGIHRGILSIYENDKAKPNLRYLRILSELYGLNYADMMKLVYNVGPDDGFGILIKMCREEMQLSQTDAASLIGVDRVSLSNYELNSTPSKKVVKKICEVYGLDEHDIAYIVYDVMEESEKFSDVIKNSRLKSHLTLAEVANHMGLSYPTIIRYEAGEGIPPIPVLKKLCSLYSLDCQRYTLELYGIDAE